MSKRVTTEDFIIKARLVHGDRYDYSKVTYTHQKNKINIGCSEHGDFMQSPTNHLSGDGCPKCVKYPIRITTEDFIVRLRSKHGDKYNYSKVIYSGPKNKITIICPIHNEFEQQPFNHLRGDGCPKCTGGVGISRDDFIERANRKHGNKYDYSKVEYVNSLTKVIIGCPEHGDFIQSPTKHTNSTGCPRCGGTKQSTTEDFIKKAREVHGDRYDYSKVVYVKNDKKVIIGCPEHGDFEQQPANHLQGKTCHKCVGHGFEYVSYNEAKQILRKFKIKTSKDYFIWWKANEQLCRELGLPFQPHIYYLTHK